MLDPSKPKPSSKASSLNSLADTVKCCQSPGKSTNRTSTAWTPLSLISDITSAGFIAHSFCVECPSWRCLRRTLHGSEAGSRVGRNSDAGERTTSFRLLRLRAEGVDEPEGDCVLLLCRFGCVLREVWRIGEVATIFEAHDEAILVFELGGDRRLLEFLAGAGCEA